MIQFACANPSCRRRYHAAEQWADQRFECPGCGSVLHRVAATAPAECQPPPKIQSLRDVTEGTAAHQQTARRSNELVEFLCEQCRGKNQALASAVGGTVCCPKCHQMTRVSALPVAAPRQATPTRRQLPAGAAVDPDHETTASSVKLGSGASAVPPRALTAESKDRDIHLADAVATEPTAELLRRQSLQIIAGQIQRVILIEETIERATEELHERMRTRGDTQRGRGGV